MPDLEIDPTDKDFFNNSRNHRKIAALERRMNHLRQRVKDNPNLTFDAAECGALDWAIRILKKVLESHPE